MSEEKIPLREFSPADELKNEIRKQIERYKRIDFEPAKMSSSATTLFIVFKKKG